jgi:hypothetical protein
MIPAKAQSLEIETVRKLFYEGVENEAAAEKLDELIKKNYKEDFSVYPPLILAYAGGTEALKAKHAFSPFSKFSYLMSSLDILETAVAKSPADLEIRFIRFSILDNIPGFFGYSSERNSDKNVIIKELLRNDFSRLGQETQKGITEYLLRSDNVTEAEKNILLQQIVKRVN